MIAAEQRLKDAGYGDKFILAQEDEDNDQVPTYEAHCCDHPPQKSPPVAPKKN